MSRFLLKTIKCIKINLHPVMDHLIRPTPPPLVLAFQWSASWYPRRWHRATQNIETHLVAAMPMNCATDSSTNWSNDYWSLPIVEVQSQSVCVCILTKIVKKPETIINYCSHSTSAKYANVSADVARMSSSKSSVQSLAKHGNVLYTIRWSTELSEPERCMYVKHLAAANWTSATRARDSNAVRMSAISLSS